MGIKRVTEHEQGEVLRYLEKLVLEKIGTRRVSNAILISCNTVSNRFMCEKLGILLNAKNGFEKEFRDNKIVFKTVFLNLLKASLFAIKDRVFVVAKYDERNHNIILGLVERH